jgi:hypothetical protein
VKGETCGAQSQCDVNPCPATQCCSGTPCEVGSDFSGFCQ